MKSTETTYGDPITLTYEVGTYYDETDPMHVLRALDEDGEMISELYADLTTGQIMQVETIASRRREGIATALAEYADEQGIELLHSPEEHRTPEGDAWAYQLNDLATIDA